MHPIVRLDHVIRYTPDIRAAFEDLVGLGFPEAWPVGRFWPGALTCGIALGGLNLELLESLDNPPVEAVTRTLVFEPSDIPDTEEALTALDVPYEVVDKIEPNHALLRLRGFDEMAARTPQRICTNVAPIGFDFFFCEYSPFLRHWLSPGNPRMQAPRGVVTRVVISMPDSASGLLKQLGAGLDRRLVFVPGERQEVLRFEFSNGADLVL